MRSCYGINFKNKKMMSLTLGDLTKLIGTFKACFHADFENEKFLNKKFCMESRDHLFVRPHKI